MPEYQPQHPQEALAADLGLMGDHVLSVSQWLMRSLTVSAAVGSYWQRLQAAWDCNGARVLSLGAAAKLGDAARPCILGV